VRILVPSIIDPATFCGGAATTTRGLLELLASEPLGAEIELLPTPYPKGGFQHAVRQAESILRSLLSTLPSKALFQCAAGYRRQLRRRLARADYDMVLINGCDLLWALEEVPTGIPVIVWVHNIEHQLFERQLGGLPASGIVRALFARDLEKLRRMEIEGLCRAAGTVFLSSVESECLRPALDGCTTLVVPPLFHDPPAVRNRPEVRGRIEVGFLANLDWWPNRDALRWFLAEVLPQCRGRLRVHLFGIGGERFERDDAVVVHGCVPDLGRVWAICDAMICPIRSGGGVNVKLAEALYHGVPVLATHFAIDGLPVRPCGALAVMDRAHEWVDFVHSDRLATLVRAEVPAELREVFSPAMHGAEVAAYFRKVIGEKVSDS